MPIVGSTPNIIVSIRGTHGSGKSHLVRDVIQQFNAIPEGTDEKGKIDHYVGKFPNGRKFYVVGSYANACGGCDGIQPYDRIWPRVVSLYSLGHVIFEGALVSSSYGNIGRASEQYGNNFVFAFLNTPLDVCLQRIVERRKARGNDKPLNPDSTTYKFKNVNRSIDTIKNQFGRRVVILDYRNPLPQLLQVFGCSPLQKSITQLASSK